MAVYGNDVLHCAWLRFSSSPSGSSLQCCKQALVERDSRLQWLVDPYSGQGSLIDLHLSLSLPRSLLVQLCVLGT